MINNMNILINNNEYFFNSEGLNISTDVAAEHLKIKLNRLAYFKQFMKLFW